MLQHSRVRVEFGRRSFDKLGSLAVDEGATRVLLVTDPGIVRAGHARRALDLLREAGLEVTLFDGVCENPTTREVDAGLHVARELNVDFLVGLGGGSSMDCAKGINFLLANGGRMEDYWGVGKATRPMLPLICVPTTAGTGSEAQSFALITDPVTHQKMACGDEKALPRGAILEPSLLSTVPFAVAAATGIDAIAHAVETAGSRNRTAVSRQLSVAAWKLLAAAFEPSLALLNANDPQIGKEPGNSETLRAWVRAAPESLAYFFSDKDPFAAMLLGAHLAGAAIEKSMLGAAHACANPLTARCGITHGVAVGLMLPHVIRHNAATGENPYSDLCSAECPDAESLAERITRFLLAARLPLRLRDLNVDPLALEELARSAAEQWTAGFNPRPVTAADLLEIYEPAF
ncbi:MAG TPA: iron-containing alcohol dehydrogenase [Phycisphaerae bacterium]|nr:iron-containing alcohol dehydrogenase [Phycisphaerae bacterium]